MNTHFKCDYCNINKKKLLIYTKFTDQLFKSSSNYYHLVNIDEDDIKNYQILELIFNTNIYYKYLFHILYHYNQFHLMLLLNNNILNQ